MARINIHDDGQLAGWFDPAKSEQWDDGTRWNGQARVGLNSGSEWVDETLYRTPGGRWVLNVDRRRCHDGPDSYRFISREEARDWLLTAEYESAEVERATGDEIPDERGPGRPAMEGRDITLRVPHELLARADEAADAAGVARAEWIRRAMQAALG